MIKSSSLDIISNPRLSNFMNAAELTPPEKVALSRSSPLAKLLAKDMDSAVKFSQEANLDAITIEGAVVSRKGGMEGGYHDERGSRIIALNKMRDANVRVSALTKQEVELKQIIVEKNTNENIINNSSNLINPGANIISKSSDISTLNNLQTEILDNVQDKISENIPIDINNIANNIKKEL